MLMYHMLGGLWMVTPNTYITYVVPNYKTIYFFYWTFMHCFLMT